MSQASNTEINQFVKVVDDFMSRYSRLVSSDTRAAVYASNDAKLVADYNSAVNKGAVLKSTVEATVGAWATAKNAIQTVQDTTSIYIGDAIDWLRSQFGYKPAGGLGAFQIPAAAWVAGIVASCYAMLKIMDAIQIQIEASKLQRQNPDLPRDTAIDRARQAVVGSGFMDSLKWPLGLLGLAAFVFLTMR